MPWLWDWLQVSCVHGSLDVGERVGVRGGRTVWRHSAGISPTGYHSKLHLYNEEIASDWCSLCLSLLFKERIRFVRHKKGDSTLEGEEILRHLPHWQTMTSFFCESLHPLFPNLGKIIAAFVLNHQNLILIRLCRLHHFFMWNYEYLLIACSESENF